MECLDWFFCNNTIDRNNSAPRWQPTKSVRNIRVDKCDFCGSYLQIEQNCLSRGNHFKFCSADCWNKFIDSNDKEIII